MKKHKKAPAGRSLPSRLSTLASVGIAVSLIGGTSALAHWCNNDANVQSYHDPYYDDCGNSVQGYHDDDCDGHSNVQGFHDFYPYDYWHPRDVMGYEDFDNGDVDDFNDVDDFLDDLLGDSIQNATVNADASTVVNNEINATSVNDVSVSQGDDEDEL